MIVLLNMIRQLMKTYLHGEIKILKFITLDKCKRINKSD